MKNKTKLQEQKVRVLMDSQAFDMQTHGGVSRCFSELIKYMPEDISLSLPVLETKNIYLRELGIVSKRDYYMEYCHNHPTPLKRFWYKLITNIKYGHWAQWDRMPMLNLFETERLLAKQKFDVFHPTFFNPYFINKLGGKPFVITVHDMIPELYSQKYHKEWKEQLRGKRELIPRASHIIAVSEHTKRDIINLFGIDPEKISVIYHGIDKSPYVPKPDKNEKRIYILYVGDRGLYKNFQRFVREICPVLENHPELSVICTGKPFDSEETELFKTNKVYGRFIHKFIESDDELMDLYHYAQAFVYPSEYEGFGIPILEAYKAGCPVLLNHASCFPEIAGNAAIYFSFDESRQSLQECLEDIFVWTPAQREEFIVTQRQRLSLYSWTKAARELADVYRKVAQQATAQTR